LTDREKETLQLLAEGKSNKEVARILQPQRLHGGDASIQHHGENWNLHTTPPDIILLYTLFWKKLITAITAVENLKPAGGQHI